MIGGGPIGLLIAPRRPLARSRRRPERGRTPSRRELAASLGLDVVDPAAADLPHEHLARTGGAGADVVFEVSGSAAGRRLMTELACIRGRVVVVAIYPGAAAGRLFDVFWKELTHPSARASTSRRTTSGRSSCSPRALSRSTADHARSSRSSGCRPSSTTLSGRPAAMKMLVDCRA